MPQPELATARLRLRPRTLDDLEANLAMDLDPEVHRQIFLHGPPDPATHRAELRDKIASGWPQDGALWVVEWRTQPGFLGWCCLIPLEDSGLIEIGYRYIRAAWGRGVATEAGRAVLEHGFRTLGLDPIVAVTHPDNRASQRVLEKLGLRYLGLRFHYGINVAFYEQPRADYLAAEAGAKGPASHLAGADPSALHSS
ncbi:MAG TPA: GNAT family N-acetyltransferase [Geminicoccaceae bacterium]|nr:GNAT family N-acetyltransferase [Geminicoccaceae bacterium]